MAQNLEPNPIFCTELAYMVRIMCKEVGRNAIPPYFGCGTTSTELENKPCQILAQGEIIYCNYDCLGI